MTWIHILCTIKVVAPSKTKPLCKLLSEGDVVAFNAQVAKLGTADLVDADLRGLDLRQAHLKQADLRGAYLRDADLRGVDLSGAKLEGTSLNHAHVSGVLFPLNIAPEEIRLSVEYGTRMRLSNRSA